MAEIPQVHPGLCGHVPGGDGAGSFVPWPDAEDQGRHGGSQCLSLHLLRDDLLRHRNPIELQETLAGRDRETGGGLPPLPVWIHHLGRPADLVAVLPRGAAAGPERIAVCRSLNFPKRCAAWSASMNPCCPSRLSSFGTRSPAELFSCWGWCC